jgi:hypothetical protein
MTAVNTNDSHLHRLPKTPLWIPLLSSENRTLLNDCLFFLLTIFSQWLFFSAHGYGFSVRVPKQRLLRRGWDGSQNGFPKSPARGFRFWFLHTVFLGGKEWEQRARRLSFSNFILFTVQHMESP